MLKLSHSAPGWGVIIVVVQVGAVKIYVAAGKALRKNEMLKLSHSAQGWGVIIVVVQVGAVKISAAAGKALRKKEKQDETQFTTKVDGFPSCPTQIS
jgi:hypothetical protein